MVKSKKFRCLLIHPGLPANRRHKRILPLGLLYLAAYIRKKFDYIDVAILDAHIENLSVKRTSQKVISVYKPDVVGIGYWTAQANFAYSLTSHLKRKAPHLTVVHGGVHPTCCPEEALTYADIVVKHEGEETFAKLMDALGEGKSWKGIPGIEYMERGERIVNEPAEFIKDLDSMPFPAWELVPMEKYNTPLHIVGGPRLPIIASRGCPYHCSFCVSPIMWKRRVRWRSGKSVAQEMESVGFLYGLKQFHFWDDNLLLNRKVVEELSNEIINRDMKLKWVGLTRVDHVIKNHDLLPLLREAGCIGFEVGIESTATEALKFMEKDQTVEQIKQAFEYQKKAGMQPLYTLMAFNPGENLNTYYHQTCFINSLLDGSHKHKLFVGQFATAYPKTKFLEEVKEQGLFLAENWDDYHHHNIKFIPHSLLNDVPERTSDRLHVQDVFVLLMEAYLWRYDAFHSPYNVSMLLRRVSQDFRGLLAMNRLFDGRRTLREIGEKTAEALRLPPNEGLKFAAFTAMIMAQMGLLKSGDIEIQDETKKVKPRKVDFNRKLPSYLYMLFSRFDKWLSPLISSFSRQGDARTCRR